MNATDTQEIKSLLLTSDDGYRQLAEQHHQLDDRLHQLAEKGIIEEKDGAAYEEAYHFIQQTRMQHHQQQARDAGPSVLREIAHRLAATHRMGHQRDVLQVEVVNGGGEVGGQPVGVVAGDGAARLPVAVAIVGEGA